MKPSMLNLILFLSMILAMNNTYAQCEYQLPPKTKKNNYVDREITFSKVSMNGARTNFLAVEKGQNVTIELDLASKKNGNYCPNCIIQIYWGIHNYTSKGAVSFHGYNLKKTRSKHSFKAPMTDGIYYITMGGTLDYSIKNNIHRPRCGPQTAFAVLKVGKPSPKLEVSLTLEEKGTDLSLKTSVLNPGCFGQLNKIEWSLNGKKLNYDGMKEIPLSNQGIYRVKWSNCLGYSTTATYLYKKKAPAPKLAEEPKLEDKLEVNAPVVLDHLIFDYGESKLLAEAKKELDELASILLKKESIHILLEGHTDQSGNPKSNQILSEDRVEAAKNYLVQNGIAASRIQIKGWGDQKPLIVTDDKKKGGKNRRVEVTIIEP